MKLGIGVDIGGSHISCCAVDLTTGLPLEGSHHEARVNRKASKKEIFETWARPINQTLEGINGEKPVGIGFAMPGAFNYQNGVALFEGNDKYESLFNTNVKKEFASYLDVDKLELRFINDASAFAVGTAWRGKAQGYKRSISLTLGTGFGSCFIEDGTPVVDSPRVPQHGSFWHLPFKDGIADDYFSTRWFERTYKKLTDEPIKGVKGIAEQALKNEKCMGLFEEFGENLAEFLLSWLHKFDPQILIIGGNVSKAWHLIEPSFLQKIIKNNLNLNVASSALMEDAALIGSAKLLDEQFWNKVKHDLPEK